MARFFPYENPRMRYKPIRESSLRLRAKGGVVPPSVFNLPYSCEVNIKHNSSHDFPANFYSSTIIIYADTFFPKAENIISKR
jgi:hypothetical protein